MEIIKIPEDAVAIVSSSSKGDQSKWRIGNRWVKQNSRGYESKAEILASLILQSSTLQPNAYAIYYPCMIELSNGQQVEGCYSMDFRGKKQEVTLERLFEANFTTTDGVINNAKLSTDEKFHNLTEQIKSYTGLDVSNDIAHMLAFDALILNEDRHTNNILFLYDPTQKSWEFAPIFDNGLSLLSDTKDYPLGKPISILKRKVKSKPFNSSFSKQIALYNGKPLHQLIGENELDFGRAHEVLPSQLRVPALQRLMIQGRELDG